MAVTDSIGDMLVRIKNAIGARMESVDIPSSKQKEEIARILKEEGYISKYEVQPKKAKKVLRIVLKYRPDKSGAIAMMKRVSSPGRRVYVKHDSIPRVQSGFGTAILSTPKGIMTDSDARDRKMGGELICFVS